MATLPGESAFSTRQARDVIGDLFVHRPVIYFLDLAVTLTIGYGFATMYLRAPAFSIEQVVGLVVAAFALFRAGSYIHEITHLRTGQMPAFCFVWDVCCGIPMLMPSFFYENHIDHHSSNHYGTIRDGEYLPLGAGPVGKIFLFFAQVPLLPVYIFLRFLLSPITFLHPRLRTFALERMSSFVINFRHRLMIPKSAPRKTWALLETACCLRSAALLGVVAAGIHPWTRLVQMYCLAVCVLTLNYIRNLVAHHYRNTGDPMSHVEQLEDSVNITGWGVVTELFFPLGLRFHALHHWFPSLPYHNLGTAHRRLMAQLPATSPYHKTVYPSYWSVVKELLSDARASQTETGKAAWRDRRASQRELQPSSRMTA